MTRRLIEIREDGRLIYRYYDDAPEPARSTLPAPAVISDTMPPTEQVNGQFYESKSRFRAVGRSLGLIEVGNERLTPHKRSTALPRTREERRNALHKAVQRFRAGQRPGRTS